MSQDVVSDGLNQIMNAKKARKSVVILRKHSKLLRNVLDIAKEAGYLDYSIDGREMKVEIKNLNSIDNISRAIKYELQRQTEEGSERETRRFDETKGKTFRMRGKEEAEDYRFISDPDLKDIVLDEKMIKNLETSLPESPDKKLGNMIKKFKIGEKDAEVLAKNIDIAEFFEKVVEKVNAGFALPWVTVELLRFLNYNKTSLDKVNFKVEHFIELLEMVKNGKITVLQGKQMLNKFYPKSFSVKDIAKKEGRISDKKELREIINVVVKANPKAASDYKKGEEEAFNYLIGEIMKKTNRRADFNVTRELLKEILKGV